MVLTVSNKTDYIPKWRGNDKLPVAEQIKIEHRLPTVAIKEKLFPKRFEFDAKGDVTGSFEIDRKKILEAFITGISNVAYILDDGKDVTYKVISVDNLFKAPPEFDGLIDELYNYFQDLLNRKVDEKN